LLAAPLLLVALLLGTTTPASAAAVPPGAAANRAIIWVGCGQIVKFTDAQLDQWKNFGVGGFISFEPVRD
jgi:hypothetical protein